MMRPKQTLVAFVLSLFILRGATLEKNKEAMRQKRAVGAPANMNSFSTDFNECLFKFWTTFCSKEIEPVLQMPIKCQGRNLIQLCYGVNPLEAQFAVCYNKETLIPEFTGHVLNPNIPEGGGGDEGWRSDPTVGNQEVVAQNADYAANQAQIIDNYNEQRLQFFSRGHLTPNADFAGAALRGYTYVTTNIAPQWQGFNAGNWAVVEALLRGFATQENHQLYIFTGTCGQAINRNKQPIKMNNRIVVPLYYWKAACDPVHAQSIFFWARNPTDSARGDKRENGCGGIQTQTRGIVKCNSAINGIAEIEKDVPGASKQIPQFTLGKACFPGVVGNLFTQYIQEHVNWQ